MDDFDRTKSLQELEQDDWGEPSHTSHLVTECHRLRRIPVRELTAGNLQILIGQQMALRYLIPVAIEQLRPDPFAEGDYYRGDLLESVLRADSRFFVAHSGYRQQVAEITARAFASLSALDEPDRITAEKALAEANDIFQRADYFARHGRA